MPHVLLALCRYVILNTPEVQQLLIDNLKFYRVEKKLTQANVAKSCDMLPSTYSRLETGQVSPQLQTLKRVCDAIDIPVVDYFVLVK